MVFIKDGITPKGIVFEVYKNNDNFYSVDLYRKNTYSVETHYFSNKRDVERFINKN